MDQITNNSIHLKQLNIEIIKKALKQCKAATKAQISQVTGLSVATCNNIIGELVKSKEVLELDYEESSGGRRAKRFCYNNAFCLTALIIAQAEDGKYYLNNFIVDAAQQVIFHHKVEYKSIGAQEFIDQISSMREQYPNIKALGISIPGVVDKGEIVYCVDIPSLNDTPILNALKAQCELPIVIDNCMNLAAIGFYNGQNYQKGTSIVYMEFTKQLGPGAGIIVDGRLVKGITNFAGEISFLPLGVPREDIPSLYDNEDSFCSLVAKSIICAIAIINPKTIALTGSPFHKGLLPVLYEMCSLHIPKQHMPDLVLVEQSNEEEILHGLITVTQQKLDCTIQLVKPTSIL